MRAGLLEGGLWYGVLAGPFAWALDLEASYMMVQTACDTGRPLLLHLASLATFLACLAGLAVSWRAWVRLQGGELSTSRGTSTGSRQRFLAASGMVLSTGFALVIVATEIPNLFLATRGC
jgi:hypothetical protein